MSGSVIGEMGIRLFQESHVSDLFHNPLGSTAENFHPSRDAKLCDNQRLAFKAPNNGYNQAAAKPFPLPLPIFTSS